MKKDTRSGWFHFKYRGILLNNWSICGELALKASYKLFRLIVSVFHRADVLWLRGSPSCDEPSAFSTEQKWRACVRWTAAGWDSPLPVHPPDGRRLSEADLDQLRQTVLPVQDVRVLQGVHQFVGCLALCRPLLDQRLNAQRGQVLQQRGGLISRRRTWDKIC